MDFFASTGFKPLRTMTRAMCLISSSGCSGVTLMSRSFMDLMRFQSVLEVLEEDAFFMSGRSPKRDHVNAFAGFQVHDRNGNPVQQTQGDETLLTIGKAIVFVGRRGPFEYAPGIGEVKPVIPEICFSLALIPRKAHLRTVYTSGKAVKHSGSCGCGDGPDERRAAPRGATGSRRSSGTCR